MTNTLMTHETADVEEPKPVTRDPRIENPEKRDNLNDYDTPSL